MRFGELFGFEHIFSLNTQQYIHSMMNNLIVMVDDEDDCGGDVVSCSIEQEEKARQYQNWKWIFN